jgi:TolA-binding protein
MNPGFRHAPRPRVFRPAVAAVAAGLLLCTQAPAAPRVIMPTGKEITGKAVEIADDGRVLLTTDKGVMTFPKGTRVIVDKPMEYTRAVQQLQQRQYDEAIRSLEKVIADYASLQWDVRARALLPRAYFGKRDYDKAVDAYDAAFAEDPELRKDGEAMTQYLNALRGSGRNDRLTPVLDDVIGGGSRDAAARAQVMRGKVRMEEGDTRGALFDFMRTAEFFRKVEDVQPEAHYRAGLCLEKLGDERARVFFKHVTKEYPASTYAAEAGRKL